MHFYAKRHLLRSYSFSFIKVAQKALLFDRLKLKAVEIVFSLSPFYNDTFYSQFLHAIF